jgi:hypothetical protein
VLSVSLDDGGMFELHLSVSLDPGAAFGLAKEDPSR